MPPIPARQSACRPSQTSTWSSIGQFLTRLPQCQARHGGRNLRHTGERSRYMLATLSRSVSVIFLISVGALADERAVFQLVQKNCIGCHNAKVTSGDVNLAIPNDGKTFDGHRDIWERVVSKLKTGEMPPRGVPKPAATDISAVVRWLESEFARQDASVKPDPGQIAARRLNRAEYDNTIRDLLGVDIHPASNFPQDETAFGFDNISDALNISPVLIEKYVDAAERSVRTAIFGPERLKPSMTHYPSPVRIPKLPKSLTNYDLTGLSTHHADACDPPFPRRG